MKTTQHTSVSPAPALVRSCALAASTLALLLGPAAALAQTGAPKDTNYGATQKNPDVDPRTGTSSTSSAPSAPSTTTDPTRRTNQAQPTRQTGSGYHSGAASADADAAREINARNNTGAADKLSWGDRRFVNKAADAGMEELQAAKLAARRATNPDVRAFAQKIAAVHSTVNSELMTLASQKSLMVEQGEAQDRSYKRLNKQSGAEFDQEFVEHMIDQHEDDVKLFEKASTDAKDPEIRAFAAKHVEHLRDHLQQAQNLRTTVMPTGRMDDRSGRSTTDGATTPRDRRTPGATDPGTGRGATTPDYGTTGTGSRDTSGSATGTTSPSGTTTTPRSDRTP